jgi:transcriptional regulator ATRX
LEEDTFQINSAEEVRLTNTRIMMKRSISDHLLPHQREAVEFMWKNTMQGVLEWHHQLSNTNQAPPPAPPTGSGCILAHCMGSGKTLSTLSFIATLLTNPALQSITVPTASQRVSFISRVLIICPVNVLVNWGVEFQRWVARDCRINLFTVDANMKRSKRFETLQAWYHRGGVCIIGKELYCNLIEESKKEQSKESVPDPRPSFFGKAPHGNPFTVLTFLVSPGPDLVVVDEAHIVKSSSSRLYNILKEIRTKRRISLTGSPLQNNLRELWNMVEFAKSGHLFKFEKFQNLFLRPIEVTLSLSVSRHYCS